MLNFNNLNPLRKLSSSCDAILQKSKSKKSNKADIYVEKSLPITPWKSGAFYKYRISQLKTIRKLCLNYATQKGAEILIIYRAAIENPEKRRQDFEDIIKIQDLVWYVISPLICKIRMGNEQINGKELVDLMIDPLIFKIERDRILANTWPKVRLIFLAKKTSDSLFELESTPQGIYNIILLKMIILTQD